MPRLPFIHAHSRLQEQVSAYVDGELAGRERDRVRDHLRTCAECAALARSLAGTKQLLAAMPAVEAPRSFRLTQTMVGAPARARPAPGRSVVPLRVAQMATAVAVMALGIVVVVDLGDQGSSGGQLAASTAGGAAEGAGAATSKGVAADSAQPTAPTVRPFNSGGVESQGVASPVPAARSTEAAPQAPSQSGDSFSQDSMAPVNRVEAPPKANNDARYRWAEGALGAVAIFAAGAMGMLWRTRKRHFDE